MAAQDGRGLQGAQVSALHLAQALETDILLERGIHATCGCTKFVMCPFPGTSWYYATTCRHDEGASWPPDWDFWWYDLSDGTWVSSRAFEDAHHDALWFELNEYVRTQAGRSLFYIRADGRVWNVSSGRMGGGGSVALWK